MLYTLARNYVLSRLAESQTWLALIGGITADLHLPSLNNAIADNFAHAGVLIITGVAMGIRQGWTPKEKAQ
jgi:hypothetical protein